MPCPICERATDPDYRPFCSRRCADVDLGRWLTGSYVLPTDEAPESGEASEEGRSATEDDGPRH